MAMTEIEKRTDGDDAALAAFFHAARTTAEPPLPAALLSNILADAAAVAAERQPALPARQPAVPRRWSLGRLFAPVGGWRGAAVLGASAALGFWIGIAGDVSIDSSTGTVATDSAWSQGWSRTASGEDVASDPVASFYDYAALEG